MTETLTCPQCSAQIPPDAPGGVCPYCVLQLAGSEGSPWNATSAYASGPSLPTMTELAVLFPQLEIMEFVGRGGMGAVYKARQPNLDRLVALKILLPDIGRDPTFAERFSREARALARLNHPHIVSVYDSGHVGGLYYFIMEYVDGVNLRQAIQAEQITPDKALAIVPQICEALQYAHEEGVVHRDIKPENVLLDRKGRVKVADFGLAKLLGLATPDITLTGTRQAMGTLHYMAPEQYERPQAVDHRADIYSLGVVFYELLTGKLPLGRFALPSEKVQVDVRLDDVVLKSLEREPERRYQYVSEVKTEVDSIAHSPMRPLPRTADSVFPPSRPSASPPTQQELSDRGRALVILGISALAAMPLLCVVGALPGFFGWGMDIMTLGMVVLVPLLLLGGIVMIAVGLSSKRSSADASGIPPEKLAPMRAVEREEAERAVRGPALALLILALVDIAASVAAAVLVFGNRPTPDMPNLVFILNLFVGMAIAIAATYMRRLQAHTLAMAGAVLALLPLHACWMLGIPIGIWALVVLSRGDVRRAFGILPTTAGSSGARRATPVVAVVLVILAGIVTLPLLLIGILFTRESHSKPATATVVYDSYPTKTTEAMKKSEERFAINWTKDGPMLGELVAQGASIGPEVEHAIQTALTEVYAEYLKLERMHTRHKTNEAGHQVATVDVFDLTKLEDKFWTKVDEVVTDDNQRGILRNYLTRQVLFPNGHYQVNVEVWKVGAWYHYHDGQNLQKGPQLPHHLARFWESPEKKGPPEGTQEH